MIPTLLLTGFLGAGKTTLLNRLIAYYQSRRTVLLINEFGQIGIDGQLLREGNYEMVELNKGSLFCICVRTDFIAEVERIATAIHPDLLIIEATGLADTSEMEKMLALPTLRSHIELRACICLVDCQNFLKVKEFLNVPISQVKHADAVLLNKIDLVAETQIQHVKDAILKIAPNARIYLTTFSDAPLDEIDVIRRPSSSENALPGEGRPDPVTSLTLEGQGNFTQSAWEQFRALLQPKALRVKGFVSLDGQIYHLEATDEQWEMIPTSGHPARTNQLIVIGQKLDWEMIKRQFSQHAF
ncbi:putative cobalamin biosynthesis protein CobW [Candidatus Moduliflexus flocculans]|uniref:Putative cobalamin biosynthesis protein CobW n=1 Tax=Candidatus Moduliflexus flocculans TaxID=1499966 RepID=A0A081BLR0_9BACT|nr:putative cobalamin biosynthesis protein CobW [Candidatus Moduliflexus flocculans]